MGTTCTLLPKNVKQYVTTLYSGAGPNMQREVLECKIVNLRTAYLAVKDTDLTTGEVQVWAGVCALSYYPSDSYGFCYKDMDETVGPYQSECPISILDKLTATDSLFAHQWRERCRAYHARPKRFEVWVGDVLNKASHRCNGKTGMYQYARRLFTAGSTDVKIIDTQAHNAYEITSYGFRKLKL